MDFRGRELIGDGPLWGLRSIAKNGIVADVVDFEDDAVNVIAEVWTLLGVFFGVGDEFVGVMEDSALLVGAETELIEKPS